MKPLLVFLVALAVLFTCLALCGIISNPPNAEDYGDLISAYATIIDFNSSLNSLSALQLILWRYNNLPFFLLTDDYPDMWIEENDNGTFTLKVQPQSQLTYPEGFIGPIYRPIEEFTFTSSLSAANTAVRVLPGATVALGYDRMQSLAWLEELTYIPLADWITTPTRGVFNLLSTLFTGVCSTVGIVFSTLADVVEAGAYTFRWILSL